MKKEEAKYVNFGALYRALHTLSHRIEGSFGFILFIIGIVVVAILLFKETVLKSGSELYQWILAILVITIGVIIMAVSSARYKEDEEHQ